MDTLNYILEKYNLQDSPQIIGQPLEIPIGRFKDVPRLFKELDFKVGAEIGVYRALYSKWLLNYCPGLKLYGIDSWEIYGDYKDYNSADIADAYLEAQQIAKKRNLHLIKARSIEAVNQFQDNSLDFVFIDSNHAYEYVVEDIAMWSKKVRPGGIVYGHDFDDYSNNKRRWMDMHVIDAVLGWVKSYRINPLFVLTKNKNKCWMYVK